MSGVLHIRQLFQARRRRRAIRAAVYRADPIYGTALDTVARWRAR